MIVIEEARAVLKRWREDATAGNWVAGKWPFPDLIWNPKHPGDHPALVAAERGDIALIVGTAGNPDLLDAIDLGLAFYESEADITQVPEVTALIATAILRADKEMQK